jgi:hypothetical protein
MAIITAATWTAHTGISTTGADATSVAEFCAAVDAAIRRVIYPFRAEAATITDQIIDAPLDNVLVLPAVPVRSITSLYLKWGANGDPTAFTSADLLTPYTDYYLPIDDDYNSWSRSGRVYRRGASVWGYEMRRPLGRLAVDENPCRGAIKVTYTVGPASGVPADIIAAAVTAVTYLYLRRSTMVIPTSESWNGYSKGASILPNQMQGALHSTDALSLLTPYLTVGIA